MFVAVKSLAAERRLLGWHSWEAFAVPQGTWQGVVTALLGQGPTVVHLPRGIDSVTHLTPEMQVKIGFRLSIVCSFVALSGGCGGMPALQWHLFEAGSAPYELVYWLSQTASGGRSGEAATTNPRSTPEKSHAEYSNQ